MHGCRPRCIQLAGAPVLFTVEADQLHPHHSCCSGGLTTRWRDPSSDVDAEEPQHQKNGPSPHPGGARDGQDWHACFQLPAIFWKSAYTSANTPSAVSGPSPIIANRQSGCVFAGVLARISAVESGAVVTDCVELTACVVVVATEAFFLQRLTVWKVKRSSSGPVPGRPPLRPVGVRVRQLRRGQAADAQRAGHQRLVAKRACIHL